MLQRAAILNLIIALLSVSAFGQVDPPKLEPTPDTPKQSSLIKEGVVLHDRGNYDAAISKYEEVLNENPNSVEALYEMSFSYTMKKDYKKSIELAYRGAQYNSRLLAAFYLQIGNNLDLLGEPKKSVEVYKAAIKVQPKMAMLYYNLAVSYRSLSKPDDARKAVKQAIALNADHSSSHLFLSTLWYQGGYKTPALLAACRFLALEPASQRSRAALKLVQDVMRGGASSGKNANEINIFVDPAPKKDEGDFAAVDLALGLTRAVNLAEQKKNENKTEMQLLVQQFDTFFAILSEQRGDDKSKFTWQFYVPYFNAMKQRGYVEPFVYYINQTSSDQEVVKWLNSNKGKVDAFLAWSKGYQWPSVD